MSLVSEALKKAQRDAAAREARDKGLPPPLHAPASQPFRAKRKRGPGPAAALAIAALLVAAGLGVLFWNRAGQSVATPPAGKEEKAPYKVEAAPGASGASAQPGVDPAPATAAPAAEETVPPTAAAATGSSASAPPASLPAPAASTPVPVPTPDRTATAAAPATPSMEASQRAPTTATATPSPAPQRVVAFAPPAVPPPAAAGKGGTESFVRDATLADGRQIHLGGIAYSEAAPLAYLNGKLVGVGEHVEDCRVARIERGRVTLECAGTAVVLNLK
jgi:hypothetical protein